MAKHIREEGNEKLFLLIAFYLPFDEITDVHHCRDNNNKKQVSDDKMKEDSRVIPGVNSCDVWRNSMAVYVSQTEKQQKLKKKNVGN